MAKRGVAMTVWLEITQDEYELPVAVADTVAELARIRHTTDSAICQTIKYYSRRKQDNITKDKCKYIKVQIDDKE